MGSIEAVVQELLAENRTTFEYYFDLYEELREERESLHQDIIHQILSRRDYSRGKRVYMLGGATANGKSTFINSGIRTYPEKAIKIDSDEIKEMLPEYQNMIAKKERSAAVKVHEESSKIAKEIRRIAIEEGFDIILDGIANESLNHRKDDIIELKSYGHIVLIDYVTLNTKLSLQNANLRYQKTGRFVPEEIIVEKNQKVALLIPQLIDHELFDELYLWDTNVKNHPRLILSQKSGILAIENGDLYKDFKRKAYETF